MSNIPGSSSEEGTGSPGPGVHVFYSLKCIIITISFLLLHFSHCEITAEYFSGLFSSLISAMFNKYLLFVLPLSYH